MTFDYDDNLSPKKRKNTSPARFTNVLIVAGFIMLAALIVIMMRSQSESNVDNFTEADVEATVNARLNEVATHQAITHTQVPLPTDHHTIIQGTQLRAGAGAKGIIDDTNYEVNYTFQGRANIAFIITLQGNSLEYPELILTNPSGHKVISTETANQPIGAQKTRVIGTILKSNGEYTITVTRTGGQTGNGEGNFTLFLDIPPALNARTDIDGVVTSNAWNWYIYRNDNPFDVVYTHEDGRYKPDVSVYTLNTRSEFVRQGYVLGSEVSRSELGSFDPYTIHFIAVGQSMVKPTNQKIIEASSYSIGVE